MPIRDTAETRAVTLVDVPLVRRLTESGVVLDSELCFTHDAGTPGTDLFTLLLPYRGVHTLVTRAGKRQVVGQFRMRPDAVYGHVAYIAPALDEGEEDTLWLHILDAMAAEAGRRGAHILVAEVDENAPLFRTMRLSNYSIYARQEIWRRPPGDYGDLETAGSVELTESDAGDLPGIQVLFANVVPRLVQQITDLPDEGVGLVYRKDDRVEGYIGVAEGKTGVYLTPHLHPDVFSEAPAILTAAIRQTEKCARLPVYVRVRRYQDWLDDALMDVGFELCARQAVMVRHITAGVRRAEFVPLSRQLESAPTPVKPPTSRIVMDERCDDGQR